MHFKALLLLSLLSFASKAMGAECVNQGILNTNYCDDNYDLVADPPLDHRKLIDPRPLIISYVPSGNKIFLPALFDHFTSYLESCLHRKIVFYQAQSEQSAIFAMRAGSLHISGFSAGGTVSAVNEAGAIPFATNNLSDNRLTVIVRSDSPYQTLSDLKDKRIAHTNKHSISGNLAAFVLFPSEGLTPDVDYKVFFSEKNRLSARGVKSGDYDAAIISSEALHRMIIYNEVEANTFRIIYQSEPFNSTAFAYAHNLTQPLKNDIESCFFNYTFPKNIQEGFLGSQHFVPVNYQQDWADIIKITPYANK